MAAIEREARFTTSGLTQVERDQLITKLRGQGWTQDKIARYVGMTQPGVKNALDRLAGKPKRVNTKLEVCDGCGIKLPAEDLPWGLCSTCEADL
jgi:transcriptional regulator